MEERWGQRKHIIKEEKNWALCTYRAWKLKTQMEFDRNANHSRKGFCLGCFCWVWGGVLCLFICLFVYGFFFFLSLGVLFFGFLFVFYFLVCFLAAPLGWRCLSSPSKDQKHWALTTGPPGNSLVLSSKSFVCHNAAKHALSPVTCQSQMSIKNWSRACEWLLASLRLWLDKARDPSKTGGFITANSRLKKRHRDTGWGARKLGDRGNKKTGNWEEGEHSPPAPLNRFYTLSREPELSA